MDCDAVRGDQVSAFLAGGTPASSNQVFLYCTLASFYRYAITRSLATRSPLPVEAPKAPPSAPPYIYSRDELRRLLDAVKTYRKRVNQLEPHTFRALLLVLYGRRGTTITPPRCGWTWSSLKDCMLMLFLSPQLSCSSVSA